MTCLPRERERDCVCTGYRHTHSLTQMSSAHVYVRMHSRRKWKEEEEGGTCHLWLVEVILAGHCLVRWVIEGEEAGATCGCGGNFCRTLSSQMGHWGWGGTWGSHGSARGGMDMDVGHAIANWIHMNGKDKSVMHIKVALSIYGLPLAFVPSLVSQQWPLGSYHVPSFYYKWGFIQSLNSMDITHLYISTTNWFLSKKTGKALKG